jgi:nucleolar protein 6
LFPRRLAGIYTGRKIPDLLLSNPPYLITTVSDGTQKYTMGGVKKGSEPSRAERKAKKRKLEDAIPDVPGDNDVAEEPEVTSKSEKAPKKRKRENEETDEKEVVGKKKSKKEKKEKSGRKEENGDVALDAGTKAELVTENKSEADDVVEGAQVPRKSKKERKAERKAREAAEAAASKTPVTTSTIDSESNGASISTPVIATKEKKPKKNQQNGKTSTEEKDTAKGSGVKTDGKAARFIVFIGTMSPRSD